MKKKMSTNAITWWLEGWVSQTLRVENNDNTILDVFSYYDIMSWYYDIMS